MDVERGFATLPHGALSNWDPSRYREEGYCVFHDQYLMMEYSPTNKHRIECWPGCAGRETIIYV